MPKIAVIYYSSTGNVHQLAQAVAAGAADAGAEVRLRRVAQTAPETAVDSNPAWRAHTDAVAETVQVAVPDDMVWADGFAFGTPTNFGTPSAQLKAYIDTLGPLWAAGKLANKGATAFTSAHNTHGGSESTILTLFNVFTHFGALIIPPGYTDPVLYAAGGNPYGTSVTSGSEPSSATDQALAAARYQGRRLAEYTAKIIR